MKESFQRRRTTATFPLRAPLSPHTHVIEAEKPVSLLISMMRLPDEALERDREIKD